MALKRAVGPPILVVPTHDPRNIRVQNDAIVAIVALAALAALAAASLHITVAVAVAMMGVVGLSVLVQISSQLAGHGRISRVGRPGRGVGDDLRVRIDGDMALVAIELARSGLAAMPRRRIDRRHDPIGRDPTGDPKRPIVGLFEVLTDHRGHQLGRLRDSGRQRATLQLGQ